MGRPGELIPGFLQGRLRLSEAQRKKLADLQKEVDARLQKLLTEEQKAAMKRMSPGAPPPPPPGGNARGSSGFDVDPLIALNDRTKPLRSKILKVPSLRTKYLKCVRELALHSLDWKKIGPVVSRYRELSEDDLKVGTKNLSSYEQFQLATSEQTRETPPPQFGRPTVSLKKFFAER